MKKKILLTALFLLATPLTSCGGNGKIPYSDLTPEEAKELVATCKSNTLATTYSYDYKIDSSIKLAAFKVSTGTMAGKTLYNGSQYLNERNNSGLLLVDSTTYTYNDGNDLVKLNTRKNDFEIVNRESLTPGYDFESNSVGKIFKSLAKTDIIDIKGDKNNKHKFHVGLGHTSFKNKFLSVLNFIDLTVAFNILNKISEDKWGLAFKPDCYFVFDDGNTYVKNFHFDLNLDFKDIVNVTFKLDQNFTQVGGTIDIKTPDVFKDCILDKQKIETNLTTLRNTINTSKENKYNYVLKTSVDHGLFERAYTSETKGYAERAIQNSKVYFHNELDVDVNKYSDYPEIENYKFTRAKVSNDNKVWDVKAQFGKDKYFEVDPYDNDSVDDYYMMPKTEWLNTDNVKALRKTINTKNNTTTWKIGFSTEAIKKMLMEYNKSIRLDADGEKWIDVYQIQNNFNPKNFEFLITTDDSNGGRLEDISIESNGLYTMNESENDDVKYKFNLAINEFDYESSYDIPAAKEDIKVD